MGRRRKRRRREGGPAPGAVATVDEVIAGRIPLEAEPLLRLIARVNPTDREGLSSADREARYRQKSALQGLLIAQFADELEILSDAADGVDSPVPPDAVVILRHRASGRATHAPLDRLDPEARAMALRALDEAASTPEAETLEPTSKTRDASGRPPAPDGAREDAEASEDMDPLEAGRAALEAYDYEAARLWFTEAVAQRGGALEPTLAMLELLVDTLGLFPAALDLVRGTADGPGPLPEGTASHPAVRSRLARAAAHLGDEAAARQFSEGLPTSDRAGIQLQLASHALSGDHPDLDRAEAMLVEARALEPDADRAALYAAEQRLAAARAEARAPEEEALVTAWESARKDPALASERLDALEREARALRERWPASPVARDVLQQIRAARRERASAQWLPVIDAALEAAERTPDFSAVEPLLAAAREAGVPARALRAREARLAELREAWSQREREAQVLAARAALASALRPDHDPGSLSEAVKRYAGLSSPDRRAVGESPAPAGDPEPTAMQALESWLLTLDEVLNLLGQERPRDVAAAIRGLQRAREALEERAADTLAALDALGEIDPRIAGLQEATRLRRRAERRLSAAADAAFEQSLSRVEAALSDGDLEAARHLLEDARPGARRRRHRRRLDTLDKRLGERVRRSDRERRVGELERTGHLLEARDLARALAEQDARDATGPGEGGGPGDGSPGASPWRGTAERLHRAMQQQWRVEVIALGEDRVEFLDEVGGLERIDTGPCLAPDGLSLVVARGHHQWVFLEHVDAATARVLRRGRLRTPVAMDGPIQVTWGEDRLHLVDRDATALLALHPESWEVLAFHPLRAFVEDPDAILAVDQALPIPGTPYLWLRTEGRDNELALCTVDLDRGRVARRIAADGVILTFLPGESPRVFVEMGPLKGQLFDPRGVPLRDGQVSFEGEVEEMSADPEGGPVFALVAGPQLQDPNAPRDDLADDRLELHRVAPGLRSVGRRIGVLPGGVCGYSHALYVRPGGRSLTVIWSAEPLVANAVSLGSDGQEGESRDPTRVLAFRELREAPGGRFAVAGEGTLVPPAFIATDVRGRRAVLLHGGADRVRIGPLQWVGPGPNGALDALVTSGPDAPPPRPSYGIRGMDPETALCTWTVDARLRLHPEDDRQRRRLHRDEDELRRWLEARFDERKDDPDELARLITGHLTWLDVVSPLVDRALERHPGHPLLRFLSGERYARQGRWDDVEAALAEERDVPGGFDPFELPTQAKAHRLHLLGLATFHQAAPSARAIAEGYGPQHPADLEDQAHRLGVTLPEGLEPDALVQASSRYNDRENVEFAAWSQWSLGLEYGDDPCRLEALLPAVSPLPDPAHVELPLHEPQALERRFGSIQALRLLIREADRLLDVSHADQLDLATAAAVRQLLDVSTVWRFREIQSLARLTAAVLVLQPDGPGVGADGGPDVPRDDPHGRHRSLRAVAAFLGLFDDPDRFLRRELPLPPRHNPWTPERLERLAERARAWLDRGGKGPP